jgi:phage shock protein E
MNFIKNIFGFGNTIDFKEFIANGAVIVDVRSPEEFRMGNIKGSINIPLQNVVQKTPQLVKGKKVIAVCQSGARSSMATSLLKNIGYEVYNGGGWNSLQGKI